MKKKTINFSWPAILSDFQQDEVQGNFSRGKLKVFYKGETPDHRYFSEDFAEKLIKTLPYTPVVSYYNEDEEDFEGHAYEQNIYGIVDPCTEVVFEECEDGKNWCIADVVLYTERPDKTGEIAKKIVGQPHSLELNPKTVKYVINYDEKKHFKNIEFTAGDFVGVSVLGKNQKPAFTGSEFFAYDEQFEDKMQKLREYCEKPLNEKQDGGEIMDLEEFMTLSWGEISSKVGDAIYDEYKHDAYTYIVDMYADFAIARFYYYMESGSRLMKIYYTCDEAGNVVLGDIKEVHVAYEEVEQNVDANVQYTAENQDETNIEQIDEPSIDAVNSLADNNNTNDDDDKEDEEENKTNCENVDDENEPEENNEDNQEDFVTTSENNSENVNDTNVEETTVAVENNSVIEEPVVTQEPAQVSDVTITPTQMEASVENEQITNNEETTTSSTSLSESERAEFETLKREKKISLINSYKEFLSEDEFSQFTTNVDSFTDDVLELELLKAYKRNQETQSNTETTRRAFAFAPINNASNESPLDAFVRKNKR